MLGGCCSQLLCQWLGLQGPRVHRQCWQAQGQDLATESLLRTLRTSCLRWEIMSLPCDLSISCINSASNGGDPMVSRWLNHFVSRTPTSSTISTTLSCGELFKLCRYNLNDCSKESFVATLISTPQEASKALPNALRSGGCSWCPVLHRHPPNREQCYRHH